MKALLCEEYGPIEKLVVGERDAPQPGPGQVRIAVHACGINFADTLIVQGKYQEKPALPFSPGLEVAGEVVELGDGVEGLAPGDRVICLCGNGGMAEEVCGPASSTVRIPDEMDFETAAGFSVTYGTSHVALDFKARLQPGETLLVHGAAGGVGLTAVELGKLMGATVIATASTDEKLALAKRYGADHLINYSQGEFREQVKALTNGAGADVIYDPVGGDTFDQSVRCINWDGRILVIGFASGVIPKLSTNIALVKSFSVMGLYWGAYTRRKPAVLQDSWRTLLDWYAQGKLRPHISRTFALQDGASALAHVAGRQATGKVVVTVRP